MSRIMPRDMSFYYKVILHLGYNPPKLPMPGNGALISIVSEENSFVAEPQVRAI